MAELLPCPFCGASAERYGTILRTVRCTNEACDVRIGEDEVGPPMEWDEVEARWNRRQK